MHIFIAVKTATKIIVDRCYCYEHQICSFSVCFIVFYGQWNFIAGLSLISGMDCYANHYVPMDQSVCVLPREAQCIKIWLLIDAGYSYT